MPNIKRLEFIGLEYVMPPEKAFGMSRAIGNRRMGGLVELETDAGVTGYGEAFGDPHTWAKRLGGLPRWPRRCRDHGDLRRKPAQQRW